MTSLIEQAIPIREDKQQQPKVNYDENKARQVQSRVTGRYFKLQNPERPL